MSSHVSEHLPRLTSMLERSRAGRYAVERAEFRAEFGQCEAHGRYPLNVIGDDGVVRWTTGGCPVCARQADVRRVMQRAEISPRFHRCTFDTFEQKTPAQARAAEVCRAYANEFGEVAANGRCLILRGNPGTGKNHLAVAITKQVLVQGFTAMHATAYEIVCRIRETWGRRQPGEKSEQDVMRTLGNVDLLVIDEVGRQYGTDSEQIHLFHVIDHRYRLRKATIIISNKEPDGIRSYLGDAAYDRLREDGGLLVNFDWHSYRGRSDV